MSSEKGRASGLPGAGWGPADVIELTRSALAAGVMVVILIQHPQLDAAAMTLLGTGFAAIAVPVRRAGARR